MAEVAEVERKTGTLFPAAYKAYLLVAGHYPPTAWEGSECTIDDLPKLFEWAEHLLAECRQPPLPEQAFVFIMHQGYQFFFFIADGDLEDPPVFYYHEGNPNTEKRFDHFSDLIEVVARDDRLV